MFSNFFHVHLWEFISLLKQMLTRVELLTTRSPKTPQ